jgi:hypothetical protein
LHICYLDQKMTSPFCPFFSMGYDELIVLHGRFSA